MKKKFFFLPLLAAMALVGCSKEESDAGGGNGDSDTHYLAVSIVTTPSMGGRAGDYTQSGGQYEDGLDNENKVNKLRFYFFSENNSAVNVAAGSSINYIDVDPIPTSTPENEKHEQTLSDKLSAVLVVNTNKGDKLPAQLVAVINPPSTMTGSINLTTLRALAADYAGKDDQGNDVQKDGFIMSNAVYVNSSENIVDATNIDAQYYCDSETAAKKKPLPIYVERVVAKVRVNLAVNLKPAAKGAESNGNLVVPDATDATKTHTLIKLKYKENDTEHDLKIGEGDAAKQVYVELKGWNPTSLRPAAYLLKSLLPDWTKVAPNGMDTNWNIPTLHRCFWAARYTGSTTNTYFDFDGSAAKNFEAENYTYCNENAGRGETGIKPTSVVIPAVLCDENATPLMICEFAGKRFVDDATCSAMKNSVLNMMKAGGNEFWTVKSQTETTTEYREIGPDDIEFTTLYSAADEEKPHRYYVKAVLTKAASELTWYKHNLSKESSEAWKGTELNDILKGFEHIKIWKNGMTYYYLDIPHLGTKGSDTEFGVVRNHVYDITIDGIYGLGTPVYNPGQKIIPEPVDPDDVYIAAQVNILSWRLVSKNVTIDTGK